MSRAVHGLTDIMNCKRVRTYLGRKKQDSVAGLTKPIGKYRKLLHVFRIAGWIGRWPIPSVKKRHWICPDYDAFRVLRGRLGSWKLKAVHQIRKYRMVTLNPETLH